LQEYCGINLSTRKFYVGSTTDTPRRLSGHEANQRLGEGQVYWLVGDDHEDDYRTEEQYYLDFYFRSPGCLNLSGNSMLGNHQGRIVTDETRERLSLSLEGNDNGKYNKGQKRSHKRRLFGRLDTHTPEKTRKKQSTSQKKRCETAEGRRNVSFAGRIGALSRWGGFNGTFPESLEYRTALSSDFVNYFATYGWW
jgi:hypothetical protein